MRLGTACLLAECGEELGHTFEVLENYSGRNMFGRTAAGVVCGGWGELLAAAVLLGATAATGRTSGDRIDPTELAEELARVSADSMGHDTIFY